jgi:hypothetical protein
MAFFWLLFFLRTWNQNFLFAFAQENSPVQPLVMVMTSGGWTSDGVHVVLRMTTHGTYRNCPSGEGEEDGNHGDNFVGHYGKIRREAHRPMERIGGFMRSQ